MQLEMDESGILTIKVPGDLSFSHILGIDPDLEVMLQTCRKVVIDFQEVGHFSSELVGTLLNIKTRLPKRPIPFEVINASDWIKNSINSLGMENFFKVVSPG